MKHVPCQSILFFPKKTSVKKIQATKAVQRTLLGSCTRISQVGCEKWCLFYQHWAESYAFYWWYRPGILKEHSSNLHCVVGLLKIQWAYWFAHICFRQTSTAIITMTRAKQWDISVFRVIRQCHNWSGHRIEEARSLVLSVLRKLTSEKNNKLSRWTWSAWNITP